MKRLILGLFLLAPIISFASQGTMAGAGTETDPWQIADYEDLKSVGFSPYTMNGHYRLSADIDASESMKEALIYTTSVDSGFKPIGQFFPQGADVSVSHGRTETVPFSGSFNGAGHVIKNLRIYCYSEESTGFFSILDSAAKLDSLTFENYSFAGIRSGGIAGINYGKINDVHIKPGIMRFENMAAPIVHANYGTISNSSFSGTMSGAYVGGIAYENHGEISKCESDVENIAKLTFTFFGGISYDNKGTIQDSKTIGNVVGSTKMGGIASINHGVVERCSSSVNIEASGGTGFTSSKTDNNVTGIGGLVAIDSGKIIDSYASGNITLQGNLGGGLVGIAYGEITGCSASGTIKGVAFNGGLVAVNYGKIEKSHASGAVIGSSYLGGFAGYNFGQIKDSYSESNVDFSGASVGGFVASNAKDGVIENCYSTGDVNGSNNDAGFASENYGEISRSYSTGLVKGTTNVGGFVSSNYGNISESYATGFVYGEISVGGFAGYVREGSISQCYSTGDVQGYILPAGFVGAMYNGSIENSFSLGNISSVSQNFHQAGSFIGMMDSVSKIENTFSTGSVTNAALGIDNICAMENLEGSVKGYYWNVSNCAVVDTAAYGADLTSDQMKDSKNFALFDFESVWNLETGADFPILKGVVFDADTKDTTGFSKKDPERYVPSSIVVPPYVEPEDTSKVDTAKVDSIKVDIPKIDSSKVEMDSTKVKSDSTKVKKDTAKIEIAEIHREVKTLFSCKIASGVLQVSFAIPTSGLVEIHLLDVHGRVVSSALKNHYAVGLHQSLVNMQTLSRGRYIAVMKLNGKIAAKTILAK